MPARPSPQTARVVQLFEVLSAHPAGGVSLAEVSRRLGVHKASCHSMLTELVGAGWLLREPRRKTYQLGPALVRLGAAASANFPALDLARPAMADLTASTGAHCIAFTISDDHVTVADQVRNPRGNGHPMAVGTELPLRAPYGAALASWLPDGDRAEWLASVPSRARPHYELALSETRGRGYAVGLHVLADLRLLELASLVRAAESRGGRLGDLALSLTQELMISPEWFPASIEPGEIYDVSHIDSPILGPDGRPVLILSLVPVPTQVIGSDVARLGDRLAAATRDLTGALAAGGSAFYGQPAPGTSTPDTSTRPVGAPSA
ncbi:MAG: helix-turn-helix domain-containing protein [Actinomycetota bacterium]|nr:helix-turn-helix domain-containing protein [Actinomycetota bacterium]